MARPRRRLDRLRQAERVKELLRAEPAGWRRERLLAVQLGFEAAYDLDQIAAAVGRARSTIQTWFEAYRQGGVEALLTDGRADNPGQPGKLTPAAQAALTEGLQQGRWRSVPQIQRWLEQTHHIKLALSSLYNRLGKAGARLRVPRPRHVQNDPAALGAFRESLGEKLNALQLPVGRPVRLWVLDEMRHGLHGFARRVWGLPGHRPEVPTQQVYQWGYAYGAVSVGWVRSQFLLAETVDRTHLAAYYRQIGASDPAALHVLIQDGAGFHLPDGHPDLPDNVRVVSLPPYSPQLNPVEGLWDQVKDELCNRVFATLEEQRVVLGGLLRQFAADAQRVRRLIPDWLLTKANTSTSNIIPVF